MIRLADLLEDTTVTVAKINREAKKHGIKLVAGRGYYYWVGLNSKTERSLGSLDTTSVYVYRASQLDWNKWMTELDGILARMKKGY